MTLNRAPSIRSMKQGTSGAPVRNAISAGVRRNQVGRPRKFDLDAVPAEMTIHQQRDDAVVGEPLPDLQRGVE